MTPAVGTLGALETAAGVAASEDFLRCRGVIGATFGGLDPALDLGCEPDWEALAYGRARVVMTSHLCVKPAPIDAVTPDFSDGNLAGQDAARARRLGSAASLSFIRVRSIRSARRSRHPPRRPRGPNAWLSPSMRPAPARSTLTVPWSTARLTSPTRPAPIGTVAYPTRPRPRGMASK